MELIRLVLITMFVCLIITHINGVTPLPSANSISTSKQTSLKSELKKLKYKFTTEINVRSQSNDTIEITIEDPCNFEDVNKRVTCKLDDPNFCKLCPYTTCKHFDKEITIGTSIIPKNNEGEGYCVAFKDMSSGCNKHHGNWAMIKASSFKGNLNSNTYIRFCLCKRPGFIGNMTLFGNCEHPFICDGDVVNINVPYNDIECKCLNEFKSKIIGDNWHSCVPPSVGERVNWSTVPKPHNIAESFIPVKTYFDKMISYYVGNLDELIDPCSRCPVTGKPTYARSVTINTRGNSDATVICRPAESDEKNEPNWGIPLRRHTNTGSDGNMKRLLKGSWGPDVMLAIKWKELWVYDVAKHNKTDKSTQDCVFVFNYKDNEDFYLKLGLDKNYQYAINAGKDAFLGLTVLPMSTFTPTVLAECHRGGIIDYNPISLRYKCNILNENLACFLEQHEIKDFIINSKHNNISSTFLIRNYQQKRGLYIDDSSYWDAAQELGRAFGVALYEFNDESYQYLTYNPAIRSNQILKKNFPFVAMRVRPMSDKEMKNSHWKRHRISGIRHFVVDFVVTNDDKSSEGFLTEHHHHTADTNFVYK
ncbi:GSCOCT00014035001.2-RA-CDS [Cotesia congregata]|uniref:Cc_pif1 n=1 Tax=Cotesia congregata TaxID=51543 RepID=A0A8J2ELZ5_COTCN|nr:GSCOCT00014035001.2-RA-CDS [Cotesia congregata]CAG5073360.1 Cc_pif1 [Cotesia congregata]